MSLPVTFIFICLAENQVATFVDVQVLEEGGVRRHALSLLREHASCAMVEIRRGDEVWEVVGRDGVRAIAVPSNSGSHDAGLVEAAIGAGNHDDPGANER